MEDQEVFISVQEDNMKQKNYYPSIVVLANQLGKIEQNGGRIINKTELRNHMASTLNLSRYKCNSIIDVFLDLKLNEQGQNKDELYLLPVKQSFLKMLGSTAKYCINNLNILDFKIYCYLYNKYNIHKFYNHIENYYFSEKEIRQACGYNTNNANVINQFKQALITLEKLGLIDYNHKNVGRPGKHGTYHELYAVYDYSPVQKEALQETIDEKHELTDNLVQEAMLLENNLENAELTEAQKLYVEECEKAKALGRNNPWFMD